MATPLSDFTVQNIIDELSIDPNWLALSQAQQIQLVNSAQQEIAVWYKLAQNFNYRASTMDSPIV